MVERSLQVVAVRLRHADRDDRDRGLLGWLNIELAGGLTLDGLSLRRSSEGRAFIAYPARTDSAGQRHYTVRPTDEGARQRLEREILRALLRRPEGAPSAGNGASPDGDPSVRGEQPS